MPLVPGHEGVGIIEQLGDGVTTRTVGQRVAMPWLGHACGECRYCVDGRENLCEQQYNNGYGVDGGYAEYMLADARLRGAGARRCRTTGCRAADVRGGDDVRRDQERTGRAGRDRRRLRHRRSRPPRRSVRPSGRGEGHRRRRHGREARPGRGTGRRPRRERPHERSCRGDPRPRRGRRRRSSWRWLRRSSNRPSIRSTAADDWCWCRCPRTGRITLPIFETVLKGISVIGSIVGTRQDLVEVFDLHAAGRTRVITQTRDLEQVNDSVEEVLSGYGSRPARLHLPVCGHRGLRPTLTWGDAGWARGAPSRR